MLEKNIVIITLIVPKINYLVANLTIPEWFVVMVQSMINNFLWDGKLPKMKNKVITTHLKKEDYGSQI